ncbi:hypothetical protein [Ekhidna sp.]|uniref:hypothetical protein n=1 Tax=Ekhidna sp. TaxID=2608089 RepID=UPI003B507899
MKKIIVILLVICSCQKLQPEDVLIPEYPDFKELMNQQVEALAESSIQKEVWLEGKNEVQALEMDSIMWADELFFLKEVNPNQPEYVGAFEKSIEYDFQVLELKEEESGPLKKVKYLQRNGSYQLIQITFHEDKDVYVHHRDIEMDFKEGVLNSLLINGYQKMMFKDTVRFGVKLVVN